MGNAFIYNPSGGENKSFHEISIDTTKTKTCFFVPPGQEQHWHYNLS